MGGAPPSPIACAAPRIRPAASAPSGLGVATLWLSVVVLLPLAAVVVKSFDNGLAGFWEALSAPSALRRAGADGRDRRRSSR